MDNKKIIGQRINSALALSGKMQKELAAALGVTDNTVSYYVGGKRVPSTEQLIVISKYLGVSTDYLLGLSDTPSPDIEDQAICKKLGIEGTTLDALKYIFIGKAEDQSDEDPIKRIDNDILHMLMGEREDTHKIFSIFIELIAEQDKLGHNETLLYALPYFVKASKNLEKMASEYIIKTEELKKKRIEAGEEVSEELESEYNDFMAEIRRGKEKREVNELVMHAAERLVIKSVEAILLAMEEIMSEDFYTNTLTSITNLHEGDTHGKRN